MGQKTNPNIFRLGKIKEWKSKYIEKNMPESSVMIFRDLEIKKFIFLFFAKHNLRIQNCQVHYSESSLHLAVSYYSAFNSLPTESRKIKAQYERSHSTVFQNKNLTLKKAIIKKQFYAPKAYKRQFLKPIRTKVFQNHYLLNKKSQRLDTVNNLKFYTDEKYYKTISKIKINLFISKLLKTLNFFTNKQHNIFLTLKQTNNETNFLNFVLRKEKRKLRLTLSALRRFQQNEFFEKGFNLLYNFVTNPCSALFLAEFIAIYLKKLKRPNFFLRFLKTALETFVSKKKARFKQVQIKIRGRFNGTPRSRQRFLSIGKEIPVLTLKSNIDYGTATAYTSNGSFGIKVWICKTTTKSYYVKCTKKGKI